MLITRASHDVQAIKKQYGKQLENMKCVECHNLGLKATLAAHPGQSNLKWVLGKMARESEGCRHSTDHITH